MCSWGNDFDHEFKDHLKTHVEKFFPRRNFTESERKKKIEKLINEKVDNEYFMNKANERAKYKKFLPQQKPTSAEEKLSDSGSGNGSDSDSISE